MDIGKKIGGWMSDGLKATARFGGSVTEQSSDSLAKTVKETQDTLHDKINQSTMNTTGKVVSHIGTGIAGYALRGFFGLTKIIGNSIKNEIGKK